MESIVCYAFLGGEWSGKDLVSILIVTLRNSQDLARDLLSGFKLDLDLVNFLSVFKLPRKNLKRQRRKKKEAVKVKKQRKPKKLKRRRRKRKVLVRNKQLRRRIEPLFLTYSRKRSPRNPVNLITHQPVEFQILYELRRQSMYNSEMT